MKGQHCGVELRCAWVEQGLHELPALDASAQFRFHI